MCFDNGFDGSVDFSKFVKKFLSSNVVHEKISRGGNTWYHKKFYLLGVWLREYLVDQTCHPLALYLRADGLV